MYINIESEGGDRALASVERGWALLSVKVDPHWYRSINLDELNMDSFVSCILGQLYGSYDDGLAELKLASTERFDKQDAVNYGFMSHPFRGRHSYDCGHLTWIWYTMIEAKVASELEAELISL